VRRISISPAKKLHLFYSTYNPDLEMCPLTFILVSKVTLCVCDRMDTPTLKSVEVAPRNDSLLSSNCLDLVSWPGNLAHPTFNPYLKMCLLTLKLIFKVAQLFEVVVLWVII